MLPFKLNIKKYNNLLLKSNYTKKYLPHSHCNYCGDKFHELVWPRDCQTCQNQTFTNPIPVAVGVLPFRDDDYNIGLLLVRRAIKPFFGELCLPGGFVNNGESWQEAMSREVFEETTLETDPSEFKLWDVHSTPEATRVLIFGHSKKLRKLKDLEKTFKPSTETESIVVGKNDTKLCFSIHQQIFNDWMCSYSHRYKNNNYY
jgi:ADP-ribose pyrophosphatase YjhB (NUDIX family)